MVLILRRIISHLINELIWRHVRTFRVAQRPWHYPYHYNTQAEYVKLSWDFTSVDVFWWLVTTTLCRMQWICNAHSLLGYKRDKFSRGIWLIAFHKDCRWSVLCLDQRSWTNQNLQSLEPYPYLAICCQVWGQNGK